MTSELSLKEYLNWSVWFICTNAMCTRYWTFSGWEWSPSVGGLMYCLGQTLWIPVHVTAPSLCDTHINNISSVFGPI